MIYEYACPRGHKTEEVLPVAMRDEPGPCPCGAVRSRLVSKPAKFVMPEHMTDENISANARHREWLASDQARAMNLERVGEDPDGPDQDPIEQGDPLELFDTLDQAAETRSPHYVESAAAALGLPPADVVDRISRAERAGTAEGTMAALAGADEADPIIDSLDSALEVERAS